MHRHSPPSHQRGATIFVVMVMVLLTTLMLLWASRSARFNELVTGNDSDYQRALEAAQAMVRDAEFDIAGTGPNNLPCLATTGNACRGSAVTTSPAAAHYPIPLESELNTTLEEILNAQTPSCLAGICTPANVTPEFWTTASTLADMKEVAATYGSYTGTATATIGNPLLRHDDETPPKAWYWVELLPYNVQAAGAGAAGHAKDFSPDLDAPYVYRITGLAEGRKASTLAVVQTIFIRRKAKS